MAPKRKSTAEHSKDKRQRRDTSKAITSSEKQEPFVHSGNKALKCSICRRKFKIPQMLPCGHCFCKDDLRCLAPLGTKTISCPQCQKQFPVPNGDTTQFPINFHLKELVDEQLILQRMTGGGEVKFSCTCCDVGNQSEVVAKCQECAHYLCTAGLAKHKHYRRWRQHNVCVLEEITEMYMELRSRTVKTTHEYKYERKADDWAIFDALYDEEDSTHLLRYWTQLCELQQSEVRPSTIKTRAKTQEQNNSNGNSNSNSKSNSKSNEAMVNHYLMCLDNLEKSGLTDRDSLAKKQQQVAIFFKQAGQYDKALELLEKTMDIESKELGERPENMSQLFLIAGQIYSEISNCVSLASDLDQAVVQKQIKYARQSLKLRKTMKGDENKFYLARVLRLLSDGLRVWIDTEGNSTLSVADAETEGMKCIDESIEIFTQLNAKGNVAKCLVNKGNLYHQKRDSTKQEKLYRESLTMCEETYGDCNSLSGVIHRNMSIVYEERSDYYEAYNWLVKCLDIYKKVQGPNHPQTQMIYENLTELKSKHIQNMSLVGRVLFSIHPDGRLPR